MKILVLEDNYERNQWFQKKFAFGHQLFITTTAAEAIAALKLDTYDVIFLDHDLKIYHYDAYARWSEEAYVQDCIHRLDKETGFAVAKFLSENSEISPQSQIIIHTQNTIGGRRMFATLKSRAARELLERRVELVSFSTLQRLGFKING